MSIKFIDLNIGMVMSHWTLQDAVRELISNALDEHSLRNVSDDIIIKKENNWWIIKDFGSGIQSDHFVIDENVNKKNVKNKCIGNFGYGLKDALGLFVNNSVDVVIYSSYGKFTPIRKIKDSATGKTLHMVWDSNSKIDMGTEIKLNVSDNIIKLAMDKFVKWNGSKLLFRNSNGEIYENKGNCKIYFNGMQIAENNDYFFSYNVTNPSETFRGSLDRERNGMNKTRYAYDVVKIIKNMCEIGGPSADVVINHFKNIYSYRKERVGELGRKDICDALGVDVDSDTDGSKTTVKTRKKRTTKNKKEDIPNINSFTPRLTMNSTFPTITSSPTQYKSYTGLPSPLPIISSTNKSNSPSLPSPLPIPIFKPLPIISTVTPSSSNKSASTTPYPFPMVSFKPSPIVPSPLPSSSNKSLPPLLPIPSNKSLPNISPLSLSSKKPLPNIPPSPMSSNTSLPTHLALSSNNPFKNLNFIYSNNFALTSNHNSTTITNANIVANLKNPFLPPKVDNVSQNIKIDDYNIVKIEDLTDDEKRVFDKYENINYYLGTNFSVIIFEHNVMNKNNYLDSFCKDDTVYITRNILSSEGGFINRMSHAILEHKNKDVPLYEANESLMNICSDLLNRLI